MSAYTFVVPFRPAFEYNGTAIPGAQAFFTYEGTNIEAPVYEDEAMTVLRANPVVANAVGRFPEVYMSASITYRVRIYNQFADVNIDAPLEDYDPYLIDNTSSASSIEYTAPGTGAITRTVQNRLSDSLFAADFGVVPSSPNIAPAMALARAAAISQRKELIIPGGTYTATEKVELSGVDLRVIGTGRVFIQSSASPIVSVDAGEETKEYGNYIENLTLIGDGSSGQVGFYTRNSIQAVRRNIWVRNVKGKGFDIEGDVLSLYENCRSTHPGVPDTNKPDIGWHVRGSTELGATADCTFLNDMAEVGTQHGWLIEDAHDCTWIGGTSEGINGIGIELKSTTSGHTFINMFYEMNDGDDLIDAGKSNRHINITAASTNALSVRVKPTAVGCLVEGGDSFHSIEIESGAVNTTFRNFECVNFTDAGTGTVRQDFKIQFDSGARYPGQTLGNVESFDPKVLDWYEQGSVTASLGGSTGDGSITQTGTTTYTRIGDRVFFETTINVSTASSWPTGNLLIRTGLPWNAAVDYTPSLGRLRNITIPASCDQFWLDGVTGTPNVRIWGLRKDGGAPDIATDANITGGNPVDIQISGVMPVAS